MSSATRPGVLCIGSERALGLACALVLLGACPKRGDDESESKGKAGAKHYAEGRGENADPSPPAPAAPTLPETDARLIYFLDQPHAGDHAWVHFDNGLDEPLYVFLPDQRELEVPPRSRTIVMFPRTVLSFRTKAGDRLDDIEVYLLSHHTYVYNPRARWDYVVETRAPGKPSAPSKRELRGLVFFDQGIVHAPFAPFPHKGAEGEALVRLAHLGAEPVPERSVRTTQYATVWWSIVEVADGEITAQVSPRFVPPDSVLFVDNATTEAIELELDGRLLPKVAPGAQLRVNLCSGKRSLRAAGEKVTAELAAGKRYAWSPRAAREYLVERKAYGGKGGAAPASEVLKQTGVFAVKTDYAFVPFPDSAPAGMRTRLALGRALPPADLPPPPPTPPEPDFSGPAVRVGPSKPLEPAPYTCDALGVGDDEDACREHRKMSRFQCSWLDRVASDALQPSAPIAECVRSNHSVVKECRGLDPEGYDDCVTSTRAIRLVGCRDPSGVVYVLHVPPKMRVLANDEALREHYAPLESGDEALAYLLLATSYRAVQEKDLAEKKASKGKFLVADPKPTEVFKVDAGWRVRMFTQDICGCIVPNLIEVELGITPDGHYKELGRREIWRAPKSELRCAD